MLILKANGQEHTHELLVASR